jgi:hypothetical protein
MSTDLRLANQNNVANVSDRIVNRWAQVVERTKPTNDAIVKLRISRQKWDDLDDYSPKAQLAVLPDKQWIEQAAQLIDDAVRKSAPEGFYYLALGAMLEQIQSAKNVTPAYQFGVVDMVLHDHDAWERGCEPGFSAPVFIAALREARRSDEKDFAPGAARVLNCCLSNRKRFRQAGVDLQGLASLRHNAEQELAELQKFPVDNSDCPF